MNNEQHRNVQTRGAQGIEIFSVLIAAGLVSTLVAAYHAPFKEWRDDVREQVKTYLAEKFDTATQQPKTKPMAASNCAIVPISHSPAAMMVMAEKFPNAGCESKP